MAIRLCEDVNAFTGEERAFVYPAREFTFREVEGVSREYEFARLKVLSGLAQRKIQMVICSIEALLQYTLPPKTLREKHGSHLPRRRVFTKDLTARLLHAGYERRIRWMASASFRCGGGILDFIRLMRRLLIGWNSGAMRLIPSAPLIWILSGVSTRSKRR